MISVCLAAYNGEKFIKEQLESILHQLNIEDEVLVSDDGSTDNTLGIIEAFNDPRISIHRNSFSNPVSNFEYLINNAKGDFIFLSDQDDVWAIDKVQVYLECFSQNPGVSLILSDIQIVDKEGLVLNKEFYEQGFKTGLIQNIITNNFIGCSMVFKQEIKKYILPFPKNLPMHDWWIGTCCILFGKIHFINKKLLSYRRHDNNFTKTAGSVILKIKWRFNLVINLLFRFIKVKANS